MYSRVDTKGSKKSFDSEANKASLGQISRPVKVLFDYSVNF